MVVGLPNEPLTTDREHRVKVQFPWQRGASPLAGGLGHDERSADAQGNAPGNERSGTWVRVAQPAAGANWGSVAVPRIGTEVLVDFVEGDIDRPLIVGQLYNGADTPPFSAGVDSGVNHPGVVSGVHTHALDGAGFNQWVVDDASGQLRMRLLAWGVSDGYRYRIKPIRGWILQLDGDASEIGSKGADSAIGGFFSSKTPKYFDEKDDGGKPLYARAVAKLGAPALDEVLAFEPALRLGGSASVTNLVRRNVHVQLSLLAQLGGHEVLDREALAKRAFG